MQIHGMCLVKNESDIISQCLRAATAWCDLIYVFDNGSEDGTWELVRQLAEKYPQIVLYKQDGKPFTDGLRAEIFNHFRDRSSEGDWWCRLDADEFYVDDPRTFLAKVPNEYKVVWSASLNYYFTDKDSELYRQQPSLYADDVPVEEKCRYYLNHWSEPRFFRDTKGLVWRDGGWPQAVLKWPVYGARILVKHFEYRSPEQIEKRLQTRRPAITVVDSSKLNYDAFDRRYVINEDLMPPLPPESGSRLALSALRSFKFLTTKQSARIRDILVRVRRKISGLRKR
jgi:glycosyltransferase involved in cell wall biosynthesis